MDDSASTTPGAHFQITFKDKSDLSTLKWSNQPKFSLRNDNGKGLEITMDAKTDFWQKTYYNPLLINHNGHVLYHDVTDDKVVMETEFELKTLHQFDQAGIFVEADEEHWIKAGLEFCDGVCRLGCVVTNGYSDWSTQVYPSSKLALRVYKLKNDYLIEAKKTSDTEWEFIRICHLHVDEKLPVKMGPFACAPTDSGGSAVFSHLSCKPTQGHAHTN